MKAAAASRRWCLLPSLDPPPPALLPLPRSSHTEFVGRVGESVSFVTGYAVQAADGSSAEPQVSAGIAEAAASIDNAGCAPEDS